MVIGGSMDVIGTRDNWCLGIIVPGVGFSGMEAVDKEITVVMHSIMFHGRGKHLKLLGSTLHYQYLIELLFKMADRKPKLISQLDPHW